MPRLHLFELEDQSWLPPSVRAYSTDCLRALFSAFVGRSRVGERLRGVLEVTGERRILDLCSGSSGPLGPVLEQLALEGLETEALLTDLHPHPELCAAIVPGARLVYSPDPLDARRVPPELPGVRTCFAGLHHFRPDDVRAVLVDAARKGRGLAVFEPSSRRLLDFAAVPLIGLLSFLAAPFLRPFRWRRLLWTWLVPLVPLVVVWDGFVSCARCYTVEELQGLAGEALEVAGAAAVGYRFEVGRDPLPGLPATVTWLVGTPATRP